MSFGTCFTIYIRYKTESLRGAVLSVNNGYLYQAIYEDLGSC